MRQALPVDRRSKWVLAYSGFAAFIAFPLIFSVGQKSTSATHAALILATLPVFTSAFGKLVERTRVSRVWLAGLALAFAGEIALIVWRAPGAAGGTLRGDALVLLSSLICSTGYVAGARLAQEGYRSLATTLWGVAGASIALVPLTAWSLSSQGWPQASAVAWGSILVLAVLTSTRRLRRVVLGPRRTAASAASPASSSRSRSSASRSPRSFSPSAPRRSRSSRAPRSSPARGWCSAPASLTRASR